MKRIIKPCTTARKAEWIEQEFNLETLSCQIPVKTDRPMIVWARDSKGWTDTVCLDYDKNTLEDLDMTYVQAVLESFSGNYHVLIKVSGLSDENAKHAYDYIAKRISLDVDPQPKDLATRGFYIPNKVIFYNEDVQVMDISHFTLDLNNIISTNNLLRSKSNSEISNITLEKRGYTKVGHKGDRAYWTESCEFVEGSRNRHIVQEIGRMAREQNHTRDLEEYAYQFIREDFTKEEIDKVINWIREGFIPIYYLKKKGAPKTGGRVSKYDTYSHHRDNNIGHTFAAIECNYSESYARKKRAQYNREHGIIMSKNNKKGLDKDIYDFVINGYKKGMVQRLIAEDLGISHSSVKKFVRKYKNDQIKIKEREAKKIKMIIPNPENTIVEIKAPINNPMTKGFFKQVETKYLQEKKTLDESGTKKKKNKDVKECEFTDDPLRKANSDPTFAIGVIKDEKDWKKYADTATKKISGLKESDTPVSDALMAANKEGGGGDDEEGLDTLEGGDEGAVQDQEKDQNIGIEVKSNVEEFPLDEEPEEKGLKIGQLKTRLNQTLSFVDDLINNPAEVDMRSFRKEIDNTIKILKKF